MARVGDEIVVVVQRARPISQTALASNTAVKVRRGDVRRAVIVRTKKEERRPDGRYIRFDDNAAVLLNNKKELLGTRINGVVSADLRLRGWSKIASIAPKVRVTSFPFPLIRTTNVRVDSAYRSYKRLVPCIATPHIA
jgi:ribosomal protein L14